MNKQNQNKRYQIPEKACHWETNFIQMKHKAIDYIKKHTEHQIHPIADAKSYLIMNSNTDNLQENYSLLCAKLQRCNFQNEQYDFYHPQNHKQLIIISSEDENKCERSNLFSQRGREINGHEPQWHRRQEYHHILPPICNLKLTKEEKNSEKERKLAALKQKQEQQTKITIKSSIKADCDDSHSHRRYHSIELKSYNQETRVSKSRAMSAFKKVINRQKVKTHHDYEKKNILTIPIDQVMNEITVKNDQQFPVLHKIQHSSHKIRKPLKKDELKIESQSIKPHENSPLDLQTLEDNKVITIYGIEPKKQQHHTHYKRFYPHVKEHKKQLKTHLPASSQKFEFTPWENRKEQQFNVMDIQIQNI